jgi:hypothetical protein
MVYTIYSKKNWYAKRYDAKNMLHEQRRQTSYSASLSVFPVCPSSSFKAARFTVSVILMGTNLLEAIFVTFLCYREHNVMVLSRRVHTAYDHIFFEEYCSRPVGLGSAIQPTSYNDLCTGVGFRSHRSYCSWWIHLLSILQYKIPPWYGSAGQVVASTQNEILTTVKTKAIVGNGNGEKQSTWRPRLFFPFSKSKVRRTVSMILFDA